jgi:hypothetical protein
MLIGARRCSAASSASVADDGRTNCRWAPFKVGSITISGAGIASETASVVRSAGESVVFSFRDAIAAATLIALKEGSTNIGRKTAESLDSESVVDRA